ncbi:MAG TPA: hypothetical protein VGE05_07940, partial [Novosphingobium sp.]
ITTHTHPRPYCRAHTTSAGRTARSLLSTPRRTPGLASGRSNAPAFGATAPTQRTALWESGGGAG